MGYLLGIDVGTSSTKVLVCNSKGKILSEADAGYPLHSPRPGWNEQDPADWFKGTVKAVRQAIEKAGVRSDGIQGIGLSGQMHGSVFLDARGKVIRRALLWNDQRTEKQCKDITRRAGGAKKLIGLVNNLALPGFTAPKILWLRDHEPANYRKVRQVLLPKDYIRFVLTGEYASEVSDASGTLLLDVRRRDWSKKLLTSLDIDPALLPPVYESTEVTGRLTRKAAARLGLKAGIPVVGGAGDQPAGAVGTGVVKSGIVSATIGTSGVVFAHADKMVANPRGVLQSFCHAVPGKWCVFGCMLAAGGSLEWARRVLYPDAKDVFAKMTKEAERAEPGGQGLFFLPYLDGERCPHPDPHARGVFIGLAGTHDRAALIRAVIEGITFGMADQVSLMRKGGVRVTQVRCGGGGARSRFWRQLQADIYNARTYSTDTENAAAFGSALLAGVGTGVWKTVPVACRNTIHPAGELRPRNKQVVFYTKQHSVYQSLYPTLSRTFPRLV